MQTLPYYGNESIRQKKGFLEIFPSPVPARTRPYVPGDGSAHRHLHRGKAIRMMHTMELTIRPAFNPSGK
jgi:hypothetical protein